MFSARPKMMDYFLSFMVKNTLTKEKGRVILFLNSGFMEAKMLCECCQKKEAILDVPKSINRIDKEYFPLCLECMRLSFCFVKRWNIEQQEWVFLS